MSVNTNDEAIKYQWRLQEWFPDLKTETFKLLQTYFELIIRHNKTINLVSPKTVPVADALHFSDSILGSQVVVDDAPQMKKIYDFGSGNGFPGLVLAILYPHIEVVLVEVDTRKVEFLKHVISTLPVTNANVFAGAVETLPTDSVHFAIARGFANISKSILVARKPIVKNGLFYHMKGDQWGMEITQIPTQLCSVWYPALVREYVLPSTQIRFGVIKTTKL